MVTFDSESYRYISNLVDPDHPVAERVDEDLEQYEKDILVGGMKIDQDTWDSINYSEDKDGTRINLSRPMDWEDVQVGNVIVLHKETMFSITGTNRSGFYATFYTRVPHRVVDIDGQVGDGEYTITLSPLNQDEYIKICLREIVTDDGTLHKEQTIQNEDESKQISNVPVTPCFLADEEISEWIEFEPEVISSII